MRAVRAAALTFLLAAVAGGAVACAAGDTAPESVLEEGRIYTAWLYGQDFDRLWNRFSPEFQRTFGTKEELADFAGRTIEQLGAERGEVEEGVTVADAERVYFRTAVFERAPGRVLVQWTLSDSGAVTGLFITPEPSTALREKPTLH